MTWLLTLALTTAAPDAGILQLQQPAEPREGRTTAAEPFFEPAEAKGLVSVECGISRAASPLQPSAWKKLPSQARFDYRPEGSWVLHTRMGWWTLGPAGENLAGLITTTYEVPRRPRVTTAVFGGRPVILLTSDDWYFSWPKEGTDRSIVPLSQQSGISFLVCAIGPNGAPLCAEGAAPKQTRLTLVEGPALRLESGGPLGQGQRLALRPLVFGHPDRGT